MMPSVLPVSYQPPGAGQIGVAGSGSLAASGVSRGQPFYVDAENGAATGGGDPNAPLATITAALALCVSGRGDVIYVAPGTYAENVVVTKDYVTIVGSLAGGYARPDLAPTAGVALTVHAQGFAAFHLRVAAFAGSDGVRQQGNGFLYQDCVFDGDTANDFNLLPDLDDDSYTASEGVIAGCLFRSGGKGLMFTNPGPGVEGGSGPSDVLVDNCRFYGHTTNDIDDTDTAGSNDKTFTNCHIRGCQFLTASASYVYILLTAGSVNTGLISGCVFADADMLAIQCVIPAGILFVNNYDGAGLAVLN